VIGRLFKQGQLARPSRVVGIEPAGYEVLGRETAQLVDTLHHGGNAVFCGFLANLMPVEPDYRPTQGSEIVIALIVERGTGGVDMPGVTIGLDVYLSAIAKEGKIEGVALVAGPDKELPLGRNVESFEGGL
jgi:hypothetical protein